MTELRQKMIKAMELRDLSDKGTVKNADRLHSSIKKR